MKGVLALAEPSLVFVGVVLYLLFTLGIGFYAGRNVKDGEDFMVAGRSLPTWLCTFTIFDSRHSPHPCQVPFVTSGTAHLAY